MEQVTGMISQPGKHPLLLPGLGQFLTAVYFTNPAIYLNKTLAPLSEAVLTQANPNPWRLP